MKKLLSVLLLGLWTGSLYGACDSTTPPTTTPRLGLAQPVINACGWGATLNTDLSIIDSSSVFLNASNNFTAAQTFTNSVTISTLTVTNNATINGQTIVKSIRFPDGTVQVSSAPSGGVGSFSGINASGSPILASSATLLGGTNVTLSQSGSTITINSISSGGGASALAVQRNAINISSPTVAINFLGPPFNVALVNAGTSQVTLDGSSVTLQGQNVIDLTSSLQTGATFYVSSGTVAGVITVSSINVTSTNGYDQFGKAILFVGGNLNANTSVGVSAMTNNSGFGRNTAIGSFALQTNTTGQSNVAVGYGALFSQIFSSNTAVGYQAGSADTTEANDVFIGFQSGVGDQGVNDVYVGANTASNNANLTNAIAIGQGIIPSASNTVYLGSTSINDTLLNGQIHISSTVLLSGAAGTSGQFLTSAGPGAAATWTTASGGTGSGIVSPGTFTWTNSFGISASTFNATTSITASSASINGPLNFSTYQSGQNNITPANITVLNSDGQTFGFTNTGYVDDSLGYRVNNVPILNRNTSTLIVGNSTAGSASGATCIGDSSCGSLSSVGQHTVAIGNGSMLNGKPGTDNTCVGSLTCQNLNPLAIQNTAIGTFALGSDFAGTDNVAIGWDAARASSGSIQNTCVGYDSCDLLTTGASNAIFGDVSGPDITTGSENTCIGGDANAFQPCQGIITGSSNTAVGNGAGGRGYLGYLGSETGDSFLGFGTGMSPGVNYSACIGYNCVVPSSFTIQMGPIGTSSASLVSMSTMTVSSGTVTSLFISKLQGVTPSLVAGTNITSITGTWPNQTVNAATQSSSGGASSLAVSTGTISGFSTPSSSPTANLNFNSTQFNATLTGAATAYVTISTMAAISISSLTVNSAGIAGSAIPFSVGTAFYVEAGGNVGVGKVPSFPLDVSGTINTPNQVIAQNFQNQTNGTPGLVMSASGANFGCVENTGGQVWDLGSCASASSDGTPILKWTGANQVIGPSASFVATPSSITFNSNIQVSSGMLLSGAAGTSGQFLTSNGPGTAPTWTTSAGGSGASTLAVQKNAVNISSPTVAINFLGPPFLVSLVNSSTAQIGLDGSSVTLQGTNVINLTSSLQPGSTFYVSSGTVAGQLTAGSINSGGISAVGQVAGASASNSSLTEATFSENNNGDTTTSLALAGISDCTGSGSASCQKSVGIVGQAIGVMQSTGTAYGVFGTVTATGGRNVALYGHANGGNTNDAVLIDSGDFVSSGTAGTSGQVLTSNGAGLMAEWKTAAGGSGSGIVSPGTFTWTNNFGMSGSTLALVNASSAFTFTASSSSTGINLVSISSSPAVNANDFLLTVSSVAGTVAFGIQNNSHVVSSGTTPSVTTCGTLPSMDPNSTDFAGTINTGSGSPTACTLTFASPFANTPVCVVSDDLQTSEPAVTTRSATAITMTLGASLSSGHIFFICVGQKG